MKNREKKNEHSITHIYFNKIIYICVNILYFCISSLIFKINKYTLIFMLISLTYFYVKINKYIFYFNIYTSYFMCLNPLFFSHFLTCLLLFYYILIWKSSFIFSLIKSMLLISYISFLTLFIFFSHIFLPFTTLGSFDNALFLFYIVWVSYSLIHHFFS